MTRRAAGDIRPPRPAATVALLRSGRDGLEVLLTHRPATMDFGPGLHVFPGGAVDPGDLDPQLIARSALAPDACAAAWAGDLEPGPAATAGLAAVRELFEEAGILLAARVDGGRMDRLAVTTALRAGTPFLQLVLGLDLVIRTDLLVPVSRWVTPPVGVTRRYDTRFFAAMLPDGAMVATDLPEVTAHDWMTPRAALDAMAEGRIELWPPTATTLRQLAAATDLDDVRRHLRPRGPAGPPATMLLGPDLARVQVHGAGGIPGATVNAYLVGRRRIVVVDPGDPNDDAVEAILDVARSNGARVTAVLLTSPTPDHSAGSTSVALRAGVPVLAGPGAGRMLSGGAEPLADGDRVDLADTPIVAHATPGTDPAHLAFELPELGVTLVGDLEGGSPTRAIPEPVDATALAESRERVARLGSLLRLPAHDPDG